MSRQLRLKDTKGNVVEFIFPTRSDGDALSDGLRWLTEMLDKKDIAKAGGGGLGGEFGYGTEFDNAVFAMHRYWWGDCECGWTELEFDEAHDPTCYQAELTALETQAGVRELPYAKRRKVGDAIYKTLTAKYNLPMFGCAVHCTCSRKRRFDEWFESNKIGPNGHSETCPVERPNFWHKPTGFKVRWYKWIGRDNEVENPTNAAWQDVLHSCIQGIGLTA